MVTNSLLNRVVRAFLDSHSSHDKTMLAAGAKLLRNVNFAVLTPGSKDYEQAERAYDEGRVFVPEFGPRNYLPAGPFMEGLRELDLAFEWEERRRGEVVEVEDEDGFENEKVCITTSCLVSYY